MKLKEITKTLDKFFQVNALYEDPSMKNFVPMVYDSIGFDRKNFFEKDFCTRFNGLMIRGWEEVKTIFLSVFPSKEVLENFIKKSQTGDLLFLHHPIFMSSWDPKWNVWTFFQPIKPEILEKIKDKQLSIYTCHAPMDTNNTIGTGVAIIEALWGKMIKEFFPFANGFAWKICEVAPISTQELIKKCEKIFRIPYCDIGWINKKEITKIGIVPWSGDNVAYMKEAEELGVDCYISWEIFNHVDTDRWRIKLQEVKEFEKTTTLSLIGVSHAASEYLVMPLQMKKYVENVLKKNVILLPMSKRRI